MFRGHRKVFAGFKRSVRGIANETRASVMVATSRPYHSGITVADGWRQDAPTPRLFSVRRSWICGRRPPQRIEGRLRLGRVGRT